jgi:plasmid stabilization system protein ParE
VRLTWRPEALDDLQRIFAFNARRSEAYAVRVERKLLERVQAIAATPQLGRAVNPPGLRRLSVTDIQYVIDYQPFADRVSIVRIRNSREVY